MTIGSKKAGGVGAGWMVSDDDRPSSPYSRPRKANARKRLMPPVHLPSGAGFLALLGTSGSAVVTQAKLLRGRDIEFVSVNPRWYISRVRFRPLHIRPSPEVRRRIDIAARASDEFNHRYVCGVLDRWLADGQPGLSPLPDESGPFTTVSYSVRPETYRAIRMTAVDLDISASALSCRILGHMVPHEVEVLAQMIAKPPKPRS